MAQRSRSLPGVLGWAVLSVALVGAAFPAAAEESEGPLARLAIHGYLTQAYGWTEENPILGLTSDGTSDYRTAALQLRYSLTAEDTFVLQLSNERFGAAPFAELKDDVEVDWVFYERRFSDATAVRLGKVQIPFGIYNEIRDVGTLLPFYRPPFNFYGEGAFTSETVDGAVLSHSFGDDSSWSLHADLYFGSWELVEVDPNTGRASVGKVDDHLGAELWLTTPIPGLRVGAGGGRFQLRDELLAGGEGEARVEIWHVSLDGDFDRWLLRSELQNVDLPPGRYRTWYVQAGFRPPGRFSVYLQGEFADLRFVVPPFLSFDRSLHEDWGLAFDVRFRSTLVLKVEGHRTEGYRIDEPILIFFEPPRDARYYIVSLSTSF